MSGDGVLRIELEPGTETWDRDDDRWRGALIDLRKAIEREVPDEVEAAPSEGKGLALIPVIVALGSSGAFTAFIEGLKAWFGRRPKTAVISGRVVIDGKVTEFTLNGANVEGGDLAAAAQAIFGPG